MLLGLDAGARGDQATPGVVPLDAGGPRLLQLVDWHLMGKVRKRKEWQVPPRTTIFYEGISLRFSCGASCEAVTLNVSRCSHTYILVCTATWALC